MRERGKQAAKEEIWEFLMKWKSVFVSTDLLIKIIIGLKTRIFFR